MQIITTSAPVGAKISITPAVAPVTTKTTTTPAVTVPAVPAKGRFLFESSLINILIYFSLQLWITPK